MDRRAMLISVAAAGASTACGEAIDRRVTAGAAAEITDLDESLAPLKTAFNTAQGKVRLLFIAGPSCGPCLRGLMDLSRSLGADLLSNQRLRIFVVYVPTLGAARHHAERAAQLIQGASVSHHWDQSGRSGNVVQQALQIPQYAWDVWLTYGPEPTWDAEAPPAPAAWMHQLGGLREGTRLDPDALAADVRARLERLA